MTRVSARRSVLLMAAAGLGLLALPGAGAQPAAAPVAASPAVQSPEVLADGRVSFRLLAPRANEVTLNGDWIGATNLPMVKGADGVWTTTVGPLAPELYGYWFSVDGVRALDPSNSETERDGSRFSSLVMVDGPASAAWRFSDVPHGTIEQVWYPSPTLKMSQRRMYVYLPPGYRDGGRTYPVLYLLHGGGGDEDAWTTMGRASIIMDNLIAAGKAEPMVVVMPNGNDEQTVSQGFGYGPIAFGAAAHGAAAEAGQRPRRRATDALCRPLRGEHRQGRDSVRRAHLRRLHGPGPSRDCRSFQGRKAHDRDDDPQP